MLGQGGLALLNGTQVSTALALAELFGAEACCCRAGRGLLSLEAIKGSVSRLTPCIMRHVAEGRSWRLPCVLHGSAIDLAPQRPLQTLLHPLRAAGDGACLDNLTCRARAAIEANAASDNPLVFDNGDVISGGNFRRTVAFVADIIALALASPVPFGAPPVLLLDPGLSGCPRSDRDSSVNSGFMIARSPPRWPKTMLAKQQRDQPAPRPTRKTMSR